MESCLPLRAGIGLRAPHYRQILAQPAVAGWLEVLIENYFGDGGQPLYFLEQVRQHYPVSFHGVGMSLGSADPLDLEHLRRLKSLVARFQPELVSEHLSWAALSGRHLNDLLPLPYTQEALDVVCDHVDQVQDCLGRQILMENISSYLQLRHSTMTEQAFISELVARTGCGILLDVNNLYVNANNHGIDPVRYIDEIPCEAVKEIHLAGFERVGALLIDTHGNRVADPVWQLYRTALARLGPIATLIEWDTDIPQLDVLLDEARKADEMLEAQHGVPA